VSGFVGALLRTLGVIAAGLALSRAFAPYNLFWLAPFAVALFTLCVYRRGGWPGFWFGALFGLATFLPLIDWMRVVGDDAWVLLSLLCTAWIAVTGAMTAMVTRLSLWPIWVACSWTTTELLRDHVPWGGFAWGRLAFSQADSPLAFLSAIGGAPLVTFAVALIGALLAAAAIATVPKIVGRPRWGAVPEASISLVVVNLLLAAVIVLGALAASATSILKQPGTESIVAAAIVQGNVPGPGMGEQGAPGQVLANHVAATETLAHEVEIGTVPRPEFVIWPESASGSDPAADPAVSASIQAAVDAIGVPVLVGSVVNNPDDSSTVLNQGIVWSPGSGPGQRYSKQHPVPFGEYIPFRSLLSRYTDRFNLIPKDFAAGTTPGILALGPATVGDAICFEVADDTIIRNSITGGGRLLVVQTNNATYGATSQPEQQLAITRLRAIEHGRTTLVAATSGVSAIISPKGKVEQRLKDFTQGTLSAEVTQTTSLTLADQLGAKPELIMASLGLGAWLFAAWRRRLGSDFVATSPSRTPQEISFT